MRTSFSRFSLEFAALLMFAFAVPSAAGEEELRKVAAGWLEHPAYGFLENKGQLAYDDGTLDNNSLFTLSTSLLDVFITKQGIKYVFLKTEKVTDEEKRPNSKTKRRVEWVRMDMTLAGADIRTENVIAEDPAQGHYNYFFSHCPQGVYEVKKYRKVTIRDVYPGIDWVVYVSGDEKAAGNMGFKYDFIVHPGADPSVIRMIYKGAGDVELGAHGGVMVKTKLGTLREEKPSTYQQGQLLASSFEMPVENEVRFRIPSYNKALDLVIDPQLSWGTLFGGTRNDGPMAICASATGEVYITGYASPNCPTVNPGGGAYYQTVVGLWGSANITKFDPNGALFWSTYYGGSTSGSMMYAQGTSLATDPSGNLLVTGNTCDTLLPLQNPGGGAYFQSVFAGPKNNFGTPTEGFILRFNNLGVRQWATYYGGSGMDSPHKICSDAGGNIYVTGSSASTNNFPVQNPGGGAYFQSVCAGGSEGDIFVLKFNSACVRQWATLYGGAQDEAGRGIEVDPAGNIYVAGTTLSAGLPLQVMGGAYNQAAFANFRSAFILKFNTGGVRQWATFCGNGNYCHALALDLNNNLYIYGNAYATAAVPITNQGGSYNQATVIAGPDAYLAKFNPAGALAWATFLGGSGAEVTDSQLGSSEGYHQLSTDCKNNVFVTGYTNSNNFPTVNPGCGAYYDGTFGGGTNYDLFLVKFNSLGAMQWSTYYGAAQYEFSRASCVDKNGLLYVTGEYVAQGNAGASQFPIFNPGGGAYYQSVNVDGFDDGFVIKFKPVNATLTTSSVAANCGANGSASVTAGCVSPPITYTWNNGSTTQTITGLTAGTYMVIVGSSGKCIAMDTAYVTVNNSGGSVAANTTGNNALCNGGTGSATVTVTSGTSPYTYSWNNGQTTSTATGLSAGTYTITVTDATGCGTTRTVSVTQPTAVTATTGSSNASCGASNGSASVTASGGTGTLTYSWSGGGQTTANATGLSAGNYTVTVTDNNGCSRTATAAVLSSSGGSVSIQSSTNVLCNGGANGQATATISGGTSPYTYSWSNGQTTGTSTGLSAGTYTVLITDANGCTGTTTAGITQPVPVVANASGAAANCSASNGSASVTASGGTGALTYSWNPTGQATATATGLSAGTYTVTVTDNNGCSRTATATVTSTGGGTASITASTNVLCNGGSNGAATATISGGTSPYTYSWSNGQTTGSSTGLSAGTYTVTVTDANGCIGTTSVNITQPVQLQAGISGWSNPNCTGGNNGTASATANGGTGTITYSWSTGATGNSITGLSAGTYTVTSTDANSCTQTATVLVTQPTVLVLSINAQTNILCNGGSTGTAAASSTGGSGGTQYVWSNGQSSASATGLSAGTYTVTATDVNGCTQTASVNITQPSAITPQTASVNANCGASNGSASVTASGGTGALTYSWNPTGQATTTATGLSAGSYTVTVTDNNGCTATATSSVANTGSGTASISGSTNVLCFGGNTGNATATITGGTGPYTYSWNNGQTASFAFGLTAGTYTVTITDANGCISTETVSISQSSALAMNTSAVPADCVGAGGSASASTSGGKAPYSYSWSNGQTNSSATGLSAGIYVCTVTDNNGCTFTQTIAVGQLNGPTATATATATTIQSGASTSLTATGGGTYSWSPTTGLSCTNCANPTASPTVTTIYCVTVTDTSGCTDQACVTVNVETPCPSNIDMVVPNAFSPNGDGHNDEIVLHGWKECVAQFIFIVYDRWGEKVFESEDPTQKWNGTYKGKKLDPAVFAYYISATNVNGEAFIKKGNITLLK